MGNGSSSARPTRFGGCLGLFLLLVVAGGIGTLALIGDTCDCSEKEVAIVVKPTETFEQLTDRLVKEGYVEHPLALSLWGQFRGVPGELQAGRHVLPPNASVRDVVNVLLVGPSQTEFSVTTIEGWTNQKVSQEIALAIVTGPGAPADVSEEVFAERLLEEMSQLEKYRGEFEFLGDVPSGRTLEGYLFPDTYQFFYTAQPEDIVRKMLQNFGVRISDELRAQTEREYGSLFDAVTLASIVQLESGRASDNAAIARVFRNRLDAGQALESDVTVNYVTQTNNQIATLEETRVDSPYNTYLVPGLPFGPVGNPGLSAIQSTVSTEDHDYFFFLTDLETGEAVFAETFSGHQDNVRTYLR